MKNKSIICFTASFPYGLKETFFENELPYLAKEFREVVIFPTYNPTNINDVRELPENVSFYKPFVTQNKFRRLFDGLFNLSPVFFYIKDLFIYNAYKKKSTFLHWLNSLLVFRITYYKFKKYITERNDDNMILYSYWAEVPLFTTDLCHKYKKAVRMHRIDFYLDENDGYLPLRSAIYNAADILLPISDDIKNILIKKYGILENKIKLNRLGISNKSYMKSENFLKEESEVIRIVTCSRVDPEKRLSLLVNTLKLYKDYQTIEWHHFGDGKLFSELKESIKDLPASVNVILHGWKTQEQIYSFYEDNYVTWFINVSKSEGIPVSIMEAMSFQIPVIATDVGGSSEIVNNSNGFLIEKDFEKVALLACILSFVSKEYQEKRKNAHKMWRDMYQAENNYKNLIDTFSELK